MKEWLKWSLGVLAVIALLFSLVAIANLITLSGPPDTEYTRILAAAVQRGDQRMPRVPGKFVHIRVRQQLPGKFYTVGQFELWLGSNESGSVLIQQDGQGKATTKIFVRDKTATTYHLESPGIGWADEIILDSADLADRKLESYLWGYRSALLAGQATMVSQSANSLVVRPNQPDPDAGPVEATLDRKTHLPISTQYGLTPIQIDYPVIEITANMPPTAAEKPEIFHSDRKLSLADARRFEKFALYYIGEEFAGYRLTDIWYQFQKLKYSPNVNTVVFNYYLLGQKTDRDWVYMSVDPKDQNTLDDLAMLAKSGLASKDGDIAPKVGSGHTMMLVILDDAVVRLYGKDEAMVRAMRAALRPLR